VRRLAGARGQSLVEFVIVANLALLLLIGIFQAGIVWYHKMTLEEASREAARAAIVSVSGGQAGMTDTARAAALNNADGLDKTFLARPGNIVVSSSIPARSTTCTQTWQPDCDVTVEIKNYAWDIGILGLVGLKVGGTLDVKTSMRIEGG
jgi:Flp pilus assembly protein TadG